MKSFSSHAIGCSMSHVCLHRNQFWTRPSSNPVSESALTTTLNMSPCSCPTARPAWIHTTPTPWPWGVNVECVWPAPPSVSPPSERDKTASQTRRRAFLLFFFSSFELSVNENIKLEADAEWTMREMMRELWWWEDHSLYGNYMQDAVKVRSVTFKGISRSVTGFPFLKIPYRICDSEY